MLIRTVKTRPDKTSKSITDAINLIVQEHFHKTGIWKSADDIKDFELAQKLQSLGFNFASDDSFMIDIPSCTFEKNEHTSRKYLDELNATNNKNFRNKRDQLFNPEIKKRLDAIIDRIISNAQPTPDPEFIVVYDHENYSSLYDYNVIKLPIQNDNYVRINVTELFHELYGVATESLRRIIMRTINSYQANTNSGWTSPGRARPGGAIRRSSPGRQQGTRYEPRQDSRATSSPITNLAMYEEFDQALDGQLQEAKSTFKGYIWYRAMIGKVLDYAVDKLLKTAFAKRLSILYIYQKINIYHITCTLKYHYADEIKNFGYQVKVYFPILDDSYIFRYITGVYKYGFYTKSDHIKLIPDRYYSAFIYFVLVLDYPVWIYNSRTGANSEGSNLGLIRIDKKTCMRHDELDKISSWFQNHPRIHAFLAVLCNINETLEKSQERLKFMYNKRDSPDENIARVDNPSIRTWIEESIQREIITIMNYPSMIAGDFLKNPQLEIALGPAGSGKSRYMEKILEKYQGNVYTLNPDAIASTCPDYMTKKQEVKDMVNEFYKDELALKNGNDDDVLYNTIKYMMLGAVHVTFVQYAWCIYYKSLEAARTRGINILTESTARDVPAFRSLTGGPNADKYKVTVTAIHANFERQYANQIARSLKEERLTNRDRILRAANFCFQTLSEILTDPDFRTVDVRLYDNTDFDINNPSNHILDKIAGVITCYHYPNISKDESGFIEMYKKACQSSGSGLIELNLLDKSESVGIIMALILLLILALILFIILGCIWQGKFPKLSKILPIHFIFSQ